MDVFSNFLLGLSVAATPENLMFCFLGALVGSLIGVLPGIGPVATLSILMPITLSLSPTAALIMLAGIYYGAAYGGSTAAILVNMPGESSSVVTCIDGHQMARQGRAGSALAIAALGSLFAGTVATLVMAFAAPSLASAALAFGASEYAALMVLGLIVAMALTEGSIPKSIAMVLVGLMLGFVGSDVETGSTRMTLGLVGLLDGVDFVPLAMGLFAIPEIIAAIEKPETHSVLSEPIRRLWPTKEDFSRAWPASLRGTALGSVLGVLPGGGGILASFLSYSIEKRISRRREEFGHGAVEGVAAPESANNAAAQTSFIPLLTLGIPSNGVVAVLAGAMLIHGVNPGPLVMTSHPDLFWGLIASMWFGNLMLVVINLPLIRLWVALLKLPYRLLYPSIIIFCCIGVYTLANSTFDIMQLAVFSAVGYLLRKLKFPPAPLLLAFILGPMLEENVRRALQLSSGDFLVFINRPISLTIVLLCVGCVVLLALPSIGRRRSGALAGD